MAAVCGWHDRRVIRIACEECVAHSMLAVFSGGFFSRVFLVVLAGGILCVLFGIRFIGNIAIKGE